MSQRDPHRNADCTPLVRDVRLARIADELSALLRPGIRLLATPLEADPPVGRTKLGGCPDLAAGTPWPTCRIEMPEPSGAFLKAHPDEPRLPPGGIVHLAFVGQINLEDVHPFDTESRLPSAGLMSFFYNPQVFASDTGSDRGWDARDLITGFSYNVYGWDNIDNWQVVYSRSTATLERREFPATLHERIKYKPHGITFRTEQTLPSIETSFLPEPNSDAGLLNVTEQEWQVLCDLQHDLRANLDIHQMLGFADQWSTTVDEGSYYWRARPRRFPESPELEALSRDERIATARNIRLLLQVGNFDHSADWWGRNGSLYFFIRDTELDEQDFSKVWGATE